MQFTHLQCKTNINLIKSTAKQSQITFRKEIKNKQVAYKQYLRTKSDINLHNYQVQRNKTKDVIHKAETNHESS